MTFNLGKVSRDNLVDVHPDLVRVVKRAVKFTEFDFRVIDGTRTLAEQKILVQKGFSQTMDSRHLKGCAVDIVPYPVDWNDIGRFKLLMRTMKAAAVYEEVPIECGGDWHSFKDYPHYQLPKKLYP